MYWRKGRSVKADERRMLARREVKLGRWTAWRQAGLDKIHRGEEEQGGALRREKSKEGGAPVFDMERNSVSADSSMRTRLYRLLLVL